MKNKRRFNRNMGGFFRNLGFLGKITPSPLSTPSFLKLAKNQRFLAKIVPLLKAICENCARDFLVLFSVFIR